MSYNSIKDGNPSRLVNLMVRADDDSPPWRAEDLADMLAHQLQVPLMYDLQRVGAPSHLQADALGRPEPAIRNFGELLHHPAPPLALLVLTKNFAKSCDVQPGYCLPSEIATLLYFGAIAAALARIGQRITSMENRSIGEGVRWALAQTWIDGKTRALFEEAAVQLNSDDRTSTENP
jgi:hypothetical protein